MDYKDLNHILDYIYEGQVQLYQEDLDSFLEVAQKLKINGLIGGQEEKESNTKDVKDHDDHVEVLENIPSFYTKDVKPNLEVNKTKYFRLRLYDKVQLHSCSLSTLS